jgi:hypothetical protein
MCDTSESHPLTQQKKKVMTPIWDETKQRPHNDLTLTQHHPKSSNTVLAQLSGIFS